MRTKDQVLLEKAYNTICEMSPPWGVAGEGEEQQTITKAGLVEVIKKHEAEHPGTTFISLTQVTPERTNKPTDPPPRFVLPGLKDGRTYFAKVTQVGGQAGFNYGANENKAREKAGMEANFVPQASIYTKDEGSKAIARLGDQLYLYYRPLSLSTTFSPVIVKATKENPSAPEDFEVISREEVIQFKRSYTPTSLTTVRNVSIDSIAAIKVNKVNYAISDLDPLRKSIYNISGAPALPEVSKRSEQSPAE